MAWNGRNDELDVVAMKNVVCLLAVRFEISIGERKTSLGYSFLNVFLSLFQTQMICSVVSFNSLQATPFDNLQ